MTLFLSAFGGHRSFENRDSGKPEIMEVNVFKLDDSESSSTIKVSADGRALAL